ncbi:hypothetical protein CYLTODRAFT_360010 [Cylindrobasidium torrendii FP15055 ss-10]|uniref:DUF1275 domain protein n=1 Tax=Cylindrobasidium torrendii FP15055 ss-10 TaxID=1314674 RepID=A0A0D7AZT8_9AGAR|nr:hypothetical protein CYLTODRAFT_360010 [Cylindrobasidium torrendii FP15055 ss-10]
MSRCGFQSGNTAQLAIAIARLWENETTQFLIADRQALTSLLAFLVGCLFARIVERIGVRTRGWMWLGTMVQAALTAAYVFASAVNQGYPGISDDRFKAGPAWDDAVSFVCLGLMSASMGLQGLMSLRLKTNSGATLPLTTTWIELLGVQALSNPKRLDTARDQRAIGILSVVLGALTARGLIFKLGSPGALGMAAGFRALVAFSWIFVPSESPALVPTTPPSATAGDEKSEVQVTSRAIAQVSNQSPV